MKKTGFTEAQIVFILKKATAGESVKNVCKSARISERTFYRWKQKYSKVAASKKYKHIDEANTWQRKLVAGVGKVIAFPKR